MFLYDRFFFAVSTINFFDRNFLPNKTGYFMEPLSVKESSMKWISLKISISVLIRYRFSVIPLELLIIFWVKLGNVKYFSWYFSCLGSKNWHFNILFSSSMLWQWKLDVYAPESTLISILNSSSLGKSTMSVLPISVFMLLFFKRNRKG